MELSPEPFEEQLRAAPEYQSLQGSTATPEYDNVSRHYNTLEYYNIPERYQLSRVLQCRFCQRNNGAD